MKKYFIRLLKSSPSDTDIQNTLKKCIVEKKHSTFAICHDFPTKKRKLSFDFFTESIPLPLITFAWGKRRFSLYFFLCLSIFQSRKFFPVFIIDVIFTGCNFDLTGYISANRRSTVKLFGRFLQSIFVDLLKFSGCLAVNYLQTRKDNVFSWKNVRPRRLLWGVFKFWPIPPLLWKGSQFTKSKGSNGSGSWIT